MSIKKYKIFVINPGSTSTKISLFNNEEEVVSANLKVSADVASLKSVWDQYEYREKSILDFLTEQKITDINAVVGRGGLLRALEGGVYKVNDKMIDDAKNNLQGEHVSNIGCCLAFNIAQKYKTDAYTVDPVSVDEFHTLAYYSGHPDIKRKALSHALNIHAVAYKTAIEINKPVADTKFVIAHLGGGISIAAVKSGKIIDVNDASSDGPFTPERTGGLPLQPFIDLCFSGKYSKGEVKKFIMGQGGLKAYLGTSDALEIETKIKSNDKHSVEVYEAMAYQISKEIGAMSAALEGNIDKIVLTGGLAKSAILVDSIIKRVKFIAPVDVVPGENEMLALTKGVLRVLNEVEKIKEY